jgi:hypothetical protein
LKRLLAPLCVFCFGMSPSLLVGPPRPAQSLCGPGVD